MTQYVVLGGAGAMGRITVRDLVETCDPKRPATIVIADFDLGKAQALAQELSDVRVRAVRIDVRNRPEAARLLAGSFVLINCLQYQLNLEAMELALALRCHYVDLGGLFHMTRKQLELHERFREISRTALLGMGAAPGITNVLARLAADQLDTVTEIHARVGSMDATRYKPSPALAVSYSLQTVLEEFSFEPAVFTRGEFRFVTPMSGAVPHRFPAPIGLRKPMYTLHSEVATLPLSFQHQGLRECSFKIAFDPEFTDRVRFLRDLGMASHEEIELSDGRRVAPIAVVNRVAMSQKPGVRVGKLKQYEVVRAIVKGIRKGKRVTFVQDLHTAGMPRWGIGLDIDTGSPPAVAAQMLAEGLITERGAVPPEVAVPPQEFFARLKKRQMKLSCRKLVGWAFKT